MTRAASTRSLTGVLTTQRTALASVLITAAIAVAGCGGDGGDESPTASTGYSAALASVADADSSQAHFEWADRAAIAALGDDRRFAAITGVAIGPFPGAAPSVERLVGFDPLAADSSVAIGTPPEGAARFDGVDADAVEGKLTELGYERDGDLLAFGEEGQVDLDAPLADLGVLAANRIAIEGDSIALSGYEEPLRAVTGAGDSTLADDPAAAAIGDCFGDVLVGIQYSAGELNAGAGVQLAGVAVTAPADPGAIVPERLCAVTSDAASAEELAGSVERGFGGKAIDPVTGRQMRDLVGTVDVQTSTSDGLGVVAATVNPPVEFDPGVLIAMTANGVIGPVLGGEQLPPPQID